MLIIFCRIFRTCTLATLQRSLRESAESSKEEVAGRVAYNTYCNVSRDALEKLYREVEGDFIQYYREINQDDESAFSARLEPEEGKLGLSVDFHNRGMFPPGAYHSEGHQDGMGVCLYLALMKRVLGDQFRFAVLDDVVMSVDSQHRKQFCKLLKNRFPGTQFIITTHDQVWANQMRSEGLIGSKSTVAFYGWTVEMGPIVEDVGDVWEKIEEDLKKDDVSSAAAKLRRHLEFISHELADLLGASVPYRGDHNYDMGALFPAVLKKHGDLLKLAANSANKWNNAAAKEQVEKLKDERAKRLEEYNGDSWVINKAVHYNEWADFSKEDFSSVVGAFKGLLSLWRCESCRSWLYLSPKINPDTLRCDCSEITLNLKS